MGYDGRVRRAFVVPAALDGTGRLVRPGEARPGEHTCPGCTARVVLRAGPVRVRHFAHGPGSCSSETALHAAAKRMLVEVALRRRAGGPVPVVRRSCPSCGAPWDEAVPDADAAIPEHRLAGGLRPDVVLLAAGVPLLALEVRVHHAVDAAKAARLPLPFLELAAGDVLADPLAWRPIAETADNGTCPGCLARAQRDARELARLAADLGLDPAGFPGWDASLARCDACGRETIRFVRGKGGIAGPVRGRAPPGVRIARVPVRERVNGRWVRGFASRTVTACFHCGGSWRARARAMQR